MDVSNLLTNLVLERAAFQPRPLLLGVENWKVVEGLWQNINVLLEVRDRLSALLHDISGQEGVLRRYKSLSEVPSRHQGANRGLHRHFERNDFTFGHIQDCLVLFNVTSCVDAAVVGTVVSELEFVKISPPVLHPPKHRFKAFLFRWHRYVVVFFRLLSRKIERLLHLLACRVKRAGFFEQRYRFFIHAFNAD